MLLDDDKKFQLMKFRRSLQDVLKPHHNDEYLLRWLRARNWNLDASEKMLRQSLKWRQEWGVDGSLKTWQPPEAIAKYQPSGTTGYDKDGAPVIVVVFGGLDIVGMLHSAAKQDLIRATVQILERNMDLSAKTGQNQVCVIFDMENWSLKQYAWRPAAEVVIQLIQMYSNNYPEILKACFIINAPRIFSVAFNIVKKFMDEYTISKIQIHGSNSNKWKKAILQNITPENLPAHYGGSLTDPDGNPKYTTKVQQGGKIPETYYLKNLQTGDPDSESEYTSVTVKKGDKLVVRIKCEEEGAFLRWDFKTDNHDIKFGITATDAVGHSTPAIQHARVSAHEFDESGVLTCQAQTTYSVIFDNSYSILRSKKLRYRVYLTPPIPDEEVHADKAEIAENNKEYKIIKGVGEFDDKALIIENEDLQIKTEEDNLNTNALTSPVH